MILKGGNDTVSFENMTLGGLGTSYGSTMVRSGYIYGSFDSGNDSISFKNIEFYKGSSGRVSLNGGAGNDTISVDGVTLGDENDGRYTQAHLSIIGGAGADVINVANVSVTGSYSTASIDGGEGADKISVTDSDNLQITSGDGNDTLTFGGIVDATITDFSTSDAIKLNDAVERGIFDNGLLTLGNVKLTLNDVTEDSISSYAAVAVTNGTTSTTLGDVVRNWTVSNGTAIYRNLYRSLITVTGLSTEATIEDISVEGTLVTISSNVLNNTTITATEGYTLAVSGEYTVPSVIAAVLNVSEGTATYIGEGSTAGYVLSANQIIYQNQIDGSNLFTITGLSSGAANSDISLEGTTVTLSANALSTENTVAITSGYSLAAASNVTISTTTAPTGWEISEGTANYIGEGKTAGYVVTDSQITYQEAKSGDALITITGLSSSATVDDISLEGTTVTLSTSAVAKGSVSISSGYALNLSSGNYTKGASIVGGSGVDTITNNGNNLVISTGAGNDLITLGSGTSKNTIIGGKGNDTITASSGKNVYKYSSGDGKDVIVGYTSNDTIQLSGSYSTTTSGQDVVVKVGSGSMTLKGAKGVSLKIKGGTSANSTLQTVTNSTSSPVTVGSAVKVINASTRTSAVNITGNSIANTIRGGSGVDTIYGGAGNDSILGNNGNDKLFGDAGNDTIYGGAGKDTLSGGAGNDKLFGDAGNDSLSGGAGADTLNGGAGNDTLYGGAGNDVFVYASSSGTDVISDYATGDKISISGAKISKSSVSGSDVILTVGSGTVRVKNGAGKTLSIYNNSKSATSTVIGSSASSTTVTLNNSSSSPYTAASGVKTINASSRTTAIRIKGNSLANSIVGGSGADSLSGGSGADTLNGGKGNDTLTGGAGNDVFFYQSGQGTDVITDYSSGDKIKITGAKISKTSVSGSDVILIVGSGSIRIKNGKDKSLSIYNNSTSATSTIIGSSSSNYEERWFLDNSELGIRNEELESIINSDSKVISDDYNYDFNTTINKKLNQTLITNSTKQSKNS